MFGTITRHVRNAVIIVIVLAVLYNESTFEFVRCTMDLGHVATRAAILQINALIYDASSSDRGTWLIACLRKLLGILSPILEPILPWTTRQATSLIRASPQRLCSMNNAVVEAGKWTVDVVMGADGRELSEQWAAAGMEVAGFCKKEVPGWVNFGFR